VKLVVNQWSFGGHSIVIQLWSKESE